MRQAGGHQLYALIDTEEEMTRVNSNNQHDMWHVRGVFLLGERAVTCEKMGSVR
jgi:hypothetical protein